MNLPLCLQPPRPTHLFILSPPNRTMTNATPYLATLLPLPGLIYPRTNSKFTPPSQPSQEDILMPVNRLVAFHTPYQNTEFLSFPPNFIKKLQYNLKHVSTPKVPTTYSPIFYPPHRPPQVYHGITRIPPTFLTKTTTTNPTLCPSIYTFLITPKVPYTITQKINLHEILS